MTAAGAAIAAASDELVEAAFGELDPATLTIIDLCRQNQSARLPPAWRAVAWDSGAADRAAEALIAESRAIRGVGEIPQAAQDALSQARSRADVIASEQRVSYHLPLIEPIFSTQ